MLSFFSIVEKNNSCLFVPLTISFSDKEMKIGERKRKSSASRPPDLIYILSPPVFGSPPVALAIRIWDTRRKPNSKKTHVTNNSKMILLHLGKTSQNAVII